jgi:hypothetical protein
LDSVLWTISKVSLLVRRIMEVMSCHKCGHTQEKPVLLDFCFASIDRQSIRAVETTGN